MFSKLDDSRIISIHQEATQQTLKVILVKSISVIYVGSFVIFDDVDQVLAYDIVLNVFFRVPDPMSLGLTDTYAVNTRGF